MSRENTSLFDKVLASAAFLTAAALAFTSLIISETHEITAGVLMACAQFLILCASILHIDYKLNIFDKAHEQITKRTSQQESTQY